MKILRIQIAFLIVLTGIAQAQVTDIDGNIYNSLDVAGNTWLSSNLQLTKFRNGDDIPLATSKKEWAEYAKNKEPAMCYANFDANNVSNYGALYNWYAVKDSRGLAPEGWHVTSKAEWKTLEKHLKSNQVSTGNIYTMGIELRSVDGWSNPSNHIEKIGFDALPGGFVNSKGSFTNLFGTTVGAVGWWWNMDGKKGYVPAVSLAGYSASSANDGNIMVLNVAAQLKAGCGLSVRCVKDN